MVLQAWIASIHTRIRLNSSQVQLNISLLYFILWNLQASWPFLPFCLWIPHPGPCLQAPGKQNAELQREVWPKPKNRHIAGNLATVEVYSTSGASTGKSIPSCLLLVAGKFAGLPSTQVFDLKIPEEVPKSKHQSAIQLESSNRNSDAVALLVVFRILLHWNHWCQLENHWFGSPNSVLPPVITTDTQKEESNLKQPLNFLG